MLRLCDLNLNYVIIMSFLYWGPQFIIFDIGCIIAFLLYYKIVKFIGKKYKIFFFKKKRKKKANLN